jgi:cytochrome c-type biogenesis protein CcmH/NrfF
LKRKFRNLLLVSLLAVTPLALAADRNERIRELSPKFMCICGGCNQVLMNCNHLGCPSREAMLRELGRQIDRQKEDDSIIGFFMEKYGTAVLSAPPASGFNLTAWVMPFLALAIGAIAAIILLRRFRARWATAPAPVADVGKYQQQLEEELKKFSPED